MCGKGVYLCVRVNLMPACCDLCTFVWKGFVPLSQSHSQQQCFGVPCVSLCVSNIPPHPHPPNPHSQIIWMIADTFSSNSNTDNLDFWNQPAMYVYTTIFNLLLYRLFWGIDIAVWTRYGVNYISVLELRNIKSNLLFVINQTTTLMTLFFISLLIFYRMNGSKETLDNSFVSYGSPLLLLIASIGIQVSRPAVCV